MYSNFRGKEVSLNEFLDDLDVLQFGNYGSLSETDQDTPLQSLEEYAKLKREAVEIVLPLAG